jgi:hypothetical protein
MTLLDDLTTEALTRDLEHGWIRQRVTSIPEFNNPDLLKPYRRAYLSDNAVTVRDTKTRKVTKNAVSNGELGRLYLRRVMGEGVVKGNPILAKRIPWRKASLQFEDRSPAYFFTGQTGGPFVLLDIKACYANLYTRLSLDMVYRPESNPPLLAFGQATFPSSPEWMAAKGPRNALWGTMLSSHGPEWHHGTFVQRAYPNNFFAPDVKGLVYDAINAIAHVAREEFGALSWAVDGGVFRPEEGRAFIQWLHDLWGLEAEVRAESQVGWLFGATSYQIGAVTTADVKKGQAREWPEMDSVRRSPSYQCSWLADSLKERAEK